MIARSIYITEKIFPDGRKDSQKASPCPGLSILKGPPGTGKTSFLRHVMFKLQDTHRFFYVPVENADILNGSHLHSLWAMEERNYPAAKKVIVLEDAETMLSDRKAVGSSNVSGLLNLTDGFVSDLIQVHLICTINCEIDFGFRAPSTWQTTGFPENSETWTTSRLLPLPVSLSGS